MTYVASFADEGSGKVYVESVGLSALAANEAMGAFDNNALAVLLNVQAQLASLRGQVAEHHRDLSVQLRAISGCGSREESRLAASVPPAGHANRWVPQPAGRPATPENPVASAPVSYDDPQCEFGASLAVASQHKPFCDGVAGNTVLFPEGLQRYVVPSDARSSPDSHAHSDDGLSPPEQLGQRSSTQESSTLPPTEPSGQVREPRQSQASMLIRTCTDFNLEVEESAVRHFLEALPQNRFTGILRYAYDRLSVIQEPERSGALHRFVHNQKWETFCISVIIINVVFSAISSDYQISHLGAEPMASDKWLEFVLIGFYTLELGLKLTVHGVYLFVAEDWRWNLFDLILVLFSLTDVMITVLLEGSGANLSVMRLFRLLKLSKILRLFRVVRFLTELRLMFNALQDSTVMLFWCLVMLALILFGLSLVIVQGLTNYLVQNADDLAQHDIDEILLHFGGVGVAMISLYKATTGGEDWGLFYRIVERAGVTYSAIFLFYTAFFTFTLFNILTGMVVENVVKASDRDDEARVMEYRRDRRQQHQGLSKLFSHLDADHSGNLTIDEFKAGLLSETVQASMDRLGLDPKDSELFFMMLASVSKDGAVDIDAFVSGCMQLRGPAAGIDLQFLIFETRQMHEALKDGLQCFGQGLHLSPVRASTVPQIRQSTPNEIQQQDVVI